MTTICKKITFLVLSAGSPEKHCITKYAHKPLVTSRPIICLGRASCEYVNQLLHSWPTHCLEKHIAILQDAIKKGISDADSEARAHSRKWVSFTSLFLILLYYWTHSMYLWTDLWYRFLEKVEGENVPHFECTDYHSWFIFCCLL